MNETTKVDGDCAREYAERGHAYWKQGNPSAAIEWFTRALELNPSDAWTLMRRGAARASIHDLSGAATDLNRAKSNIPEPARNSRWQWALCQQGEGIRTSIRDLALAPDADIADVEVLLAQMDAAISAFTEAIQEKPTNTWAYAHRAAVSVLAHWLGARFGIDQARVQHHADSAQSDLDTASRLKGDYAWATIFQAILATVMGANQPEGAERRALFDQAAGFVQEAGRIDKNFSVQHPLTEFALYNREYEKAVELGWAQLAKDPDDSVARYCVAAALTQISVSGASGSASVDEVRRTTSRSFTEQTRKTLLAKRSQTCALLGGLALMEGQLEVAAAMLNTVLEYPDMDTLVFIWCDPTWAPIRQSAIAAPEEPRLSAVTEAYRKLFPRALARD